MGYHQSRKTNTCSDGGSTSDNSGNGSNSSNNDNGGDNDGTALRLSLYDLGGLFVLVYFVWFVSCAMATISWFFRKRRNDYRDRKINAINKNNGNSNDDTNNNNGRNKDNNIK